MRTNPFDPPGYYNGCGRMPPVDRFLRYWDPKPEKELTPVKFIETIKPVIKVSLPSPVSPAYKGLRRAKGS